MKSIFILMLLVGYQAQGLKLKFNELQIKNYDEMSQMVDAHIQKSKELAIAKQESGDLATGDQLAIDELTKALKLIFARPDKDNMVAKLIPAVKKELVNYSAYTDTLNAVASDAISTIEMQKLPVEYRATAIFILENLMSEIKPQVQENQELQSIVKKIRAADLEITRDVRNHRKLVGMYNTTSPSKTARMLLSSKKQK